MSTHARARPKHYRSFLCQPLGKQYDECVELLIPCSNLARSALTGSTAVSIAAEQGRADLLKRMLRYGVQVNCYNKMGNVRIVSPCTYQLMIAHRYLCCCQLFLATPRLLVCCATPRPISTFQRVMERSVNVQTVLC